MVVSIPLFVGVLVVLALPASVARMVGSSPAGVLASVMTYLAVLVGGVAFFLVVFSSPLSVRKFHDHFQELGLEPRPASVQGVPHHPEAQRALAGAQVGAGSPRLVLVREPDQLGVERTHQ
jgi:hypothetical protein